MNILFDWAPEKNEELIKTRGVSFEEVVAILESGEILDVLEHLNREKHPHQYIYVIEIDGYVHLVPFVKSYNKIFLKTVFPDRKAQKKYLGE